MKISHYAEDALNAAHQSVSESERNDIDNALWVAVRIANKKRPPHTLDLYPLLMNLKIKTRFVKNEKRYQQTVCDIR